MKVLRAFHVEHKDVIYKPVDGMGGAGIFRVDASGLNLGSVMEQLTDNGRRAFNFNADTDVSDLLTFRLTGSHAITFDRNYNRRLSSTVVSVILQMRFFAGELR